MWISAILERHTKPQPAWDITLRYLSNSTVYTSSSLLIEKLSKKLYVSHTKKLHISVSGHVGLHHLYWSVHIGEALASSPTDMIFMEQIFIRRNSTSVAV